MKTTNDLKQWFIIQIPILIVLAILWWLVFNQYYFFEFVLWGWLAKNFFTIYDGHTTHTNKIFGVTKKTNVQLINGKGRSIKVNREDWAFNFIATPLKNMGFFGDLSGRMYEQSKVIKKSKDNPLFLIRNLIVSNKEKPINEFYLPLNVLERFVYIGYNRQQNKKTRKKAYSRNFWIDRIGKIEYYACIYIMVSNNCLLNRGHGLTGTNPYTPKETINKIRGN